MEERGYHKRFKGGERDKREPVDLEVAAEQRPLCIEKNVPDQTLTRTNENLILWLTIPFEPYSGKPKAWHWFCIVSGESEDRLPIIALLEAVFRVEARRRGGYDFHHIMNGTSSQAPRRSQQKVQAESSKEPRKLICLSVFALKGPARWLYLASG